MLYWNQVWKHMRSVTGREVEKRAVSEFITYFEKQIDMVIRQSVKELDRKNNLEEVQGVRQMCRIDRECVRRAIKNIYNNGNGKASERTGGNKEVKKKIPHSQENTEVV